jgi:colanic acid biosynthesis glycosyl transferase WcaI
MVAPSTRPGSYQRRDGRRRDREAIVASRFRYKSARLSPDAIDVPRLLCIYQHAPTRGAPGFYRHRHYLAELVRRGWEVDLVACPVDYLTGTTPKPYAGRPYVAETIAGIRHHWTWGASNIHDSRFHRAVNYLSFAGTACARALTLPIPDVIWASSPPLTIGTVGAITAKRFRRPWVFEIRDLWPESAAAVGWLSAGSRVYRLLERAAHDYASRATSVIVPTPGLERAAYAHGAHQVDVLPGIALDERKDPAVRDRVRAELEAENACLFAYVGALGVANGLDRLLDSAKMLAGDPHVAFVVAGDGSDRRRLQERITGEAILNVRLIGPVTKERAREILAAADVVLHILRNSPLFHSALPNKVIDAFSAHRPFITTVDGLPRRMAEESGGGFAATTDALASEFRRWAAMLASEREARGEQSFTYGQRRFGLSASVDRLERILESAMRLQVEGMRP